MAIINMNTRFATIKALACVSVLTLTLTACGHVTTDAEDAMRACMGLLNPDIREICISNYVVTARAGRDAQWSAIGNGMLARPYGYR